MAVGINITHRGEQTEGKKAGLIVAAVLAIAGCWWVPFKRQVIARVQLALEEEWATYDSPNIT
jgi:hypothetical protein